MLRSKIFCTGARVNRRPDRKNESSSSDSDLDLVKTKIPPLFSTGSVPPAAAKLKAEIEKRKQLWNKNKVSIKIIRI